MSPLVETFPTLADPLWLLLLPVLPWLAWHHHRGRTEGALLYSRLPAAPAERGTGTKAWRLHFPFYCRLAAFGLLAVALARPQIGYAWEESLTEGIDIQIVLDVSGSMGIEDFRPASRRTSTRRVSRLTAAKEVVKEFITGRPGDRIGLVAFSAAAVTKAPATTDRQMLRYLVESLQPGELPRGTAIGVALATAASRLRQSDAESRVIVLVTDGANNIGEIDPRSAASLCAGLGIRVYTIGVGTERGVRSPVDSALLGEIAETTDGRFYLARGRNALDGVFGEIDRLEKTELEVKRFVRYQEAFPPLAWAALALTLLPLVPATLELTAQP